MKLLVIEDDQTLLSSMVRYFRLEKFSYDIATSYEEGIYNLGPLFVSTNLFL
jgi:DNA-binding response OmpR family regulator